MRHLHPLTRRATLALACAALAVAGCGGEDPESNTPSKAAVQKAFAGSPPALAALHEQASQLLDGGPDAFKQRLAELKGHPVVVNRWAAWCDPCRREMPHLQSQALKHGKRVAFLGLDVEDNDGDAEKLLAEFPVTYPSYKDPDLKISAELNAVVGPPTTIFFDSKGEVAYLKQGLYSSEKALAEDIERYAR